MEVRDVTKWLVLVFLLFLEDVSSTKIHIDPRNGSDAVTCGAIDNPCRTLHFSWYHFLTTNTSDSRIVFFLERGVYNTDRSVMSQPLFYRCNSDLVTSIEIEGRGNGFDSISELHNSFDVLYCEINFTGLSFKYGANLTATDTNIHINKCQMQNISFTFLRSSIYFDNTHFLNSSSTNQIFAIRSENFIVTNSVFRNINLDDVTKIFLDTESVGMIQFKNVTITHTLGAQNKENSSMVSTFLRFFNTRKIVFESVTFQHNVNVAFNIIGIQTQVTANRLKVLHNVNTTLAFEAIQGNVTDVLLRTARLDRENPVVISFRKSSVILQDAQLICAGEKKFETSPISVDSLTETKCINCSTVNCKRLCGAGLETNKEIFCRQCLPGTSAHGWEKVCKECRPGYHAPHFGGSDCIPCASGMFCKERGCTSCRKCNNELFTSEPGSESCSQMSLLFIIMLGIALFLVMTPIAIKVMKNNTQNAEDDDEESVEIEDVPRQYKRFGRNPSTTEEQNNNVSINQEAG